MLLGEKGAAEGYNEAKKLAKRDAERNYLLAATPPSAMSSFRAASDENKWLFCWVKCNMMMMVSPIMYHHINTTVQGFCNRMEYF